MIMARHKNSWNVFLMIFVMHVLNANAFDVENCPGECHCDMDGLLMVVDCSGLALSELPEFPDNQVHLLDLSNNDFTAIPPQLASFEFLQYLDISENKISRLKPNSLQGLGALRMLNLSKNNISSWTSINPRTLLLPAVSLTELSLAENPITSFSTNDENLLLVSNSLRMLDLSNCKITKVNGQQVLQGMKELKQLILHGNQLRSVSDLISDSLTTLDLSNNRLTNLLPNVLTNLPALTYIDLSRNHRISLQTKQGEYVQSESLKRIDLSFCNMDNIELEGFPALITAILKGNMIRQLTRESFINTQMIEHLDLSANSVNSVDVNTFKKLKHLKTLNLSFNMIPKLERDTLKENELLVKLDLSRNFINRFNRITAPSLTHLNLTWCQIMTIDADALTGMPEIVDIDLSSNLITDIPDTLSSDTLQVLDLSMNRLTSIRNQTFAGFPEITRINLSGNRFTTPFRKEFFAENAYLGDLYLSDNPWLCNCHELFVFYMFVTDAPAKVWGKSTLRCQSPEDVAGRTWESACYFTWYPQAAMGTSEKVWTFFMVTVIAFAGCMCLIMSIKKGIEGRQQTARELERERSLEEGREIVRQNRVRMQQVAQRDAPDPRESHPPCYADAILLPRLDGSFASLDEMGNGRLKHKRHRKKNDETEQDIEDVPLRRSRARSEEVLSMREVVANSVRSPRIPPRIHPLEIDPIDRNRSPNENDTEQEEEVILTFDRSPVLSSRSSRARSPQASISQREMANENLDDIRNFDQSTNTLREGSPYAKRKLKQIENSEASKNVKLKTEMSDPGPSTSREIKDDSIVIHDDHFGPISAQRIDDSDSINSDEFITIKTGKQRDSATRNSSQSTTSSNENGIILIKKPTKF